MLVDPVDRDRPALRVLMAAAELYPLMKTGGLGDIVQSLSAALSGLGLDIKVVLPGYRDTLDFLDGAKPISRQPVVIDGTLTFELCEYHLKDCEYGIYLVKHEALFGRAGTPYADAAGVDWPDNPVRFGMFCKVVAALARGTTGLEWRPDIIHCHDWHTGLVAALVARGGGHTPTVFSIHNVAHQGVFDRDVFDALNLDDDLWSVDGLEFFGDWSFLKGGLVFAQRLVTVSPTYAREILTPQYGFGMDGVLRHRAEYLEGILNGVDYHVWCPRTDPFIATPYSHETLGHKVAAKHVLQREFGLPEDNHAFLIANVGRLTHQKGIDVLLNSLPQCLKNQQLQIAMLGSGERHMEAALRQAAQSFPRQLGIHIGYSEPLAHHVIAGADAFVMPSRFEPCGLTQLYSLAYGTVPIVHATGGLIDTVADASPANLADGTATGFSFTELAALPDAIARAHDCFETAPDIWSKIMSTGMSQDFGWDNSARAYMEVYRKALRQSSESRQYKSLSPT
jgi:starch synthase